METGLILFLFIACIVGVGIQIWYDAREEWKDGNS